MITLHELKTDPKYREMTRDELAGIIRNNNELYYAITGVLSSGKTETMIEYFKQNPLPEPDNLIEDIESQVKELRKAFNRGERLTGLDMLVKYGIMNYKGRVFNLRNDQVDPMPIITEMIVLPNKKRVGLYYLKTK